MSLRSQNRIYDESYSRQCPLPYALSAVMPLQKVADVVGHVEVFHGTRAFDIRVQLERHVDGQAFHRLLLRLGRRHWRRLPVLHPLVDVGWHGLARPFGGERHFLAAHAGILSATLRPSSNSASSASWLISWAASMSGSSSKTVSPLVALSAKATRWLIAVLRTGTGYADSASATSRPIAVFTILRLMTNAFLRLGL